MNPRASWGKCWGKAFVLKNISIKSDAWAGHMAEARSANLLSIRVHVSPQIAVNSVD
jgi:hypothetical protein